MATIGVQETLDVETSHPAINWGPIFGGAFAAVVTTAILMLRGSGLGLTMISP
jgi:hypothetical protein